jgi:hypothetical protein
MFKLDPNPTFTVEVPITEPGGTQRPLKVTFRHRTRSAYMAWRKQPQEDLDFALDMVDSIPEVPEGMTLKDFVAALIENYPAASLDLFFVYERELLESRAKN